MCVAVKPEDRCKLFCRVADSSAYYLLKDKVLDGTKCTPDTDDMCVSGTCRSAGCDHVLGSSVRSGEAGSWALQGRGGTSELVSC